MSQSANKAPYAFSLIRIAFTQIASNKVQPHMILHSASLSTQPASELLPTEDEKKLVAKIKTTHTHEIVIGLCGPIGAPMRAVALRLQAILKATYDYKPVLKKLSDFIETHAAQPIDKTTAYTRYASLIKEGNRLKSTYGNSVLAELAIADISIQRELNRSQSGAAEFQPERFCHIIDSIKNEEELDAFKSVYNDLFVCIGVHASQEERENRLKKAQVSDIEMAELIDRDSGEEKEYGQTVRDTFPRSDFFINCSSYNNNEIDQKLLRIVELILSTKIVTPSYGETAMYTAFTASLNSACLSRQVGAAVTDVDGSLLGVGWNDVPRFGGGVYSESSVPDKRCYNFGNQCHNDLEKDLIATEIATTLLKKGIIPADKLKLAAAAIKDARVKGLIEFSRAVHAEMLALLNAGKTNGERMRGGKIYVTTYPCHVCARHIIAAGVHEIHFIEPYRKSLAMKLHDDALTESVTQAGKVRLIPFEGVSPSRYVEFFKMQGNSRKNGGKLAEMDPKLSQFKADISLKSFPALERMVVEKLTKQKLLPN